MYINRSTELLWLNSVGHMLTSIGIYPFPWIPLINWYIWVVVMQSLIRFIFLCKEWLGLQLENLTCACLDLFRHIAHVWRGNFVLIIMHIVWRFFKKLYVRWNFPYGEHQFIQYYKKGQKSMVWRPKWVIQVAQLEMKLKLSQ